MSKSSSLELYVSVDVGCHRYQIAMGLSNGKFLEAFEIARQPAGFREFFSRIEAQEARYGCAVSVAMEAYNGYARLLGSLVLLHEYRLYNINNLKFARFKEIFPSAAKTDALDARKGLELFQLRDRCRWPSKCCRRRASPGVRWGTRKCST
jgi:hypothetical protein